MKREVRRVGITANTIFHTTKVAVFRLTNYETPAGLFWLPILPCLTSLRAIRLSKLLQQAHICTTMPSYADSGTSVVNFMVSIEPIE